MIPSKTPNEEKKEWGFLSEHLQHRLCDKCEEFAIVWVDFSKMPVKRYASAYETARRNQSLLHLCGIHLMTSGVPEDIVEDIANESQKKQEQQERLGKGLLYGLVAMGLGLLAGMIAIAVNGYNSGF